MAAKKTNKKTASKTTKKTTKKVPAKKIADTKKPVTKKISSKAITPKCTPELKKKILDALVDSKKNPRPQVHVDDIAHATGASVPDVTATLMVLELEHKVKSLPGKYFRLPKSDNMKPSGKRGRMPNGKLSQLDAAVEILKDAKEALTCKEIVRRMFERKLWETSGRTPWATLSASIQREIAKRGTAARFRRATRGLFELNI